MTYSEIVGERLRNIRLQKGLSLHEVQRNSGKEFKASVLGAYERGERSISVMRLQGLARFYGVPVDQLLPHGGVDEGPTTVTPPSATTIDLATLEKVEAPEKAVLQRYLNLVQMQRGDFNGRVLSIRKDDLRAIASVLDLSPDSLDERLDSLGIKVAGPR